MKSDPILQWLLLIFSLTSTFIGRVRSSTQVYEFSTSKRNSANNNTTSISFISLPSNSIVSTPISTCTYPKSQSTLKTNRNKIISQGDGNDDTLFMILPQITDSILVCEFNQNEILNIQSNKQTKTEKAKFSSIAIEISFIKPVGITALNTTIKTALYKQTQTIHLNSSTTTTTSIPLPSTLNCNEFENLLYESTIIFDEMPYINRTQPLTVMIEYKQTPFQQFPRFIAVKSILIRQICDSQTIYGFSTKSSHILTSQLNSRNTLESIPCIITKCIQCDSFQSCKVCEPYYSVNSKGTCSLNPLEQYISASVELTDIGYNIFLQFPHEIINIPHDSMNYLDNILTVRIQNLLTYEDFTSQIKFATKSIIQISIQLTTTCKYSSALIDFIDISFIEQNQITSAQTQIHIDLPAFSFLDETELEVVEDCSEASDSSTKALVAALIPMSRFQRFFSILNIVDYCTFFHYIYFLEVRYPKNAMKMRKSMNNFMLPFIPDSLSLISKEGYKQTVKDFAKYEEEPIDAYFLHNISQDFTVFLIIFALFCITCAGAFLPFPESVQTYSRNSLKGGWRYSYIIDLISFVYANLAFSSIIQFYSYDFSDYTYAWILNYVLHALVSVLTVAIIVALFWSLSQITNFEDQENQKQKISSIVNGLRLYNESDDEDDGDDDDDLSNETKKPLPDLNCSIVISGEDSDNVAVDEYPKQHKIKLERNHHKQRGKRVRSVLPEDLLNELPAESIPKARLIVLEPIPQKPKPHRQKWLHTKQLGQGYKNSGSHFKNMNMKKNSINQENSRSNIHNNNTNKNTNIHNKPMYKKDILSGTDSDDSQRNKGNNERLNKREYFAIRYSKYFNVILLLRKLIFCIVLIVLSPFVRVQLSIMIVMSVCILCFLVYVFPYENWIDNLLMILSESLMVVVYILIFVLVTDDPSQDEKERVNIGWAFIVICLFIIFVNGIYIFLVLFYNLFFYIKETCCTRKFEAAAANNNLKMIISPPKQDNFRQFTPNQEYNNNKIDLPHLFEKQESRSSLDTVTLEFNPQNRNERNSPKERKDQIILN